MFEEVKALGTDFSECRFYYTLLQKSQFRLAEFSYSAFDRVELRGSCFAEGFFSCVSFKRVTLENCDFTAASFFKTPLAGLDFTACKIDGIVLSEHGTELQGAVVDLFQAADLSRLLGLKIK